MATRARDAYTRFVRSMIGTFARYIGTLRDATVERRRTDGRRRLERGAKTAKRDWHRNLPFTAGLSQILSSALWHARYPYVCMRDAGLARVISMGTCTRATAIQPGSQGCFLTLSLTSPKIFQRLFIVFTSRPSLATCNLWSGSYCSIHWIVLS